jgi:hypothetical protein
MTENHDLAPEADVDEQQRPEQGTDTEPAEVAVPLEANPADAAEQSASVPLDEDDEHRLGT